MTDRVRHVRLLPEVRKDEVHIRRSPTFDADGNQTDELVVYELPEELDGGLSG